MLLGNSPAQAPWEAVGKPLPFSSCYTLDVFLQLHYSPTGFPQVPVPSAPPFSAFGDGGDAASAPLLALPVLALLLPFLLVVPY